MASPNSWTEEFPSTQYCVQQVTCSDLVIPAFL